MSQTGTVYHKIESVLGQVVCTDMPTYKQVELFIGGEMMIRLPLALDVDNTEIEVRLGNTCNQSNLIDPPVRVVLNS